MSSRVALVGVLVSVITACASARGSSLNEPAGLAQTRRLQFEQRRSSGRGVFFTDDEIRNAKTSTVGTLLRRVPSVRVVCRTDGCVVSMARATGECVAALLVDGHSASNSTDVNMSAAEIVGIEIYRSASETPVEFLGPESACGTIVIWTQWGP